MRGNFLLLSLAAKGKFETGQGQGQGRAARADTHPLDLLAIYRIFGKTGGLASNQTKIQYFKNYFHYRTY
jgi:hypothetical protein